ncbi:MAG: rhodanese-like domain-containing protein [Gemmatimonadota bacterium]|nr:rhodanese-like domain-containing protein [Gemmatimonadota bacterium]
MDDRGYANPDLLMTPRQLHDRLHDESTCIVDVRPTHEYVSGHIPGALHLDLYGISLNNTGAEALEGFTWTMAYLMGSRGVSSDATVVFYENDSGMRAARGFWICEYLDHSDAHVLDGGLHAWTAAGYGTTVDVPIPDQAAFEMATDAKRHIGYEEIRDSLGKADFVPLDTRSDDEYYGRVARSARGGAIPDAVHVEYLDNLDETGAFKPAAELREMYERAGVMPEQTVACY